MVRNVDDLLKKSRLNRFGYELGYVCGYALGLVIKTWRSIKRMFR